jgi:hypothetical protein
MLNWINCLDTAAHAACAPASKQFVSLACQDLTEAPPACLAEGITLKAFDPIGSGNVAWADREAFPITGALSCARSSRTCNCSGICWASRAAIRRCGSWQCTG